MVINSSVTISWNIPQRWGQQQKERKVYSWASCTKVRIFSKTDIDLLKYNKHFSVNISTPQIAQYLFKNQPNKRRKNVQIAPVPPRFLDIFPLSSSRLRHFWGWISPKNCRMKRYKSPPSGEAKGIAIWLLERARQRFAKKIRQCSFALKKIVLLRPNFTTNL